MHQQILDHLSRFSSLPVLFIGSGMSRRYIGMETWKNLLETMHARLGLPKPFGYYLSNSSDGSKEDLPKLASLMAREFSEIWWTDDRFEESRNDYQALAKSAASPLKYEIAKYIREKGLNYTQGLENELEMFHNCQVDGVITTNWDLLLEELFPQYTTFVGQEELIFSEVMSIGEIYKIHGSISEPESLLLTKEDYDDFHERNPYLASKLLNIFMEHPIIFIGYSIDDPNIQQILRSIVKILTRSNVDKLKDRLIFCKWEPTISQATITDNTIMIGDTVLPIKQITLSNFSELLNTLQSIQRRIPVKILRHMKNMVYDFVKDTEGKSKFYVADDLDKLEDLENGEFVYGIGLTKQIQNKGLTGIDGRDLIRDAIIDAQLPSDGVCKMILAATSSQYLPYFKHLSKAGFLNDKGELIAKADVPEFSKAFINKVNNITPSSFYPGSSYRNMIAEVNAKYKSIEELRSDEKKFIRQLMLIPLLEPHKIDLEQLRAFLKANIDSLVDSYHGTHYRKLVCLYDYLKYKYPKISEAIKTEAKL